MPVAVASTISPAGMVCAGKHGAGVLSLATYSQEGITAITTQWANCVEAADKAGRPAPDRASWRLVVPFHLADSKEEAINDVVDGAFRWYNEYLINIMGAPGRPPVPNGRVLIDGMNAFGGGVVGTPDDAIACIKRLQEISGGFGCLLNLGHEWTTPEKTLRSYEMFAQHVMPHFQDTVSWIERSRDWTLANKEALAERTVSAITKAIKDHSGTPEEKPAAKAGA
jgi:limonene 1,2-monooxygenase